MNNWTKLDDKLDDVDQAQYSQGNMLRELNQEYHVRLAFDGWCSTNVTPPPSAVVCLIAAREDRMDTELPIGKQKKTVMDEKTDENNNNNNDNKSNNRNNNDSIRRSVNDSYNDKKYFRFYISNDNNSINKLNTVDRVRGISNTISIIQIIHSQLDLRFNEFECYGQ